MIPVLRRLRRLPQGYGGAEVRRGRPFSQLTVGSPPAAPGQMTPPPYPERLLLLCRERVVRLEAGILTEIREREESHAETFEGLKGKYAAAASAVEELAGSSITDRFEPGLGQHVSRARSSQGAQGSLGSGSSRA